MTFRELVAVLLPRVTKVSLLQSMAFRDIIGWSDMHTMMDSAVSASIFSPSEYTYTLVIHERSTTKRCPAIILVAGFGVPSGCDRHLGSVRY